MRVFIPATFAMLEQLVAEQSMPVRSGTAFAATPALVESYTEGDIEEIEHIAFEEAARASLRLLDAEGVTDSASTVPCRRVVVSVDLDDDRLALRPDLDTAVVRLTEPVVTMQAVAAVHVDLEQHGEAVRRAVAVVDAADLGDEDAELAVGDVLDLDLAWFDPVELPFLVELR